MTIETLQTICYQLPGVTEDLSWANHLCFNVGGKSFLFTAPDSVPPSASFKVPAEDFEEIIAKDGLEPQPCVARYKWVLSRDINSLTEQEWVFYIKQCPISLSSAILSLNLHLSTASSHHCPSCSPPITCSSQQSHSQQNI